MKKSSTFLFIIVIVLLLAYWFNDNQKAAPKVSSNAPAKITSASIITDKNRSTAKINNQKNSIQKQSSSFKRVEPFNTAEKLSFLQAYRDKVYFSNCIWDLHHIQDNKNLLERHTKRVSEKKYGDILGGGTLQEEYLIKHLNKCKKLLLNPDEDISEAFDRLEYLFWSIEPITLEEKDLSQYLYLNEERKNLKHDLYNEQEKNKQDYNTIKFIKSSLKLNLDNMLANIQTNRSPDVFLLIKTISDIHIEPRAMSSLKEDSLIISKIQYETGINDKYYLEILYDNAIHFFVCSLGYPCHEGSELVYKHCVLNNNKNACGRNLEDFYLNIYISPNQQLDVDKVLAYLMSHYAQI